MKINEKNRLTRKFSPLTAIMLGVLILFSVVLLGMLFWTVMTSFKSASFSGFKSKTASTYNLPKELHFENYIKVFESFYIEGVAYPERVGGTRTVYIGEMFVYSILYCVGCSVIQTLVQCVTAYLCARFAYKLSKAVEYIVIVVMTIPIVGSLPAEITLSKDLGLYNHIYGMWVMKANFLGMYFLIFLAAFKSISMTYTEAAKIDGANPFTIMTQIIVPLATGTITTVFVLAFIGYWNDFQIPMVYLPTHPVAAYGMYEFQNSKINEIAHTPLRLAGICLMALPIVVFYAIFNKKLNVNLSVGGIKG